MDYQGRCAKIEGEKVIVDAEREEQWLRAASLCEEYRVTARFEQHLGAGAGAKATAQSGTPDG